jgi:SNF2 family DNA or RNA helicase
LNSLRHEKGVWIIKATPDITMRLKRIFPRMVQSISTELRVKATDEVANDLEWVLMRFPMEMEPAARDLLTTRAAGHRAKLERLKRIMSDPARATQFTLAHPLRPYQSVATSLYLEQGYLLLADEVGLGKTAAATASFTDKRTLPALVVVKTHLAKQWEAEIKKFIPKAWVHIIKSTKEYTLPPSDVYIITYSKLAAWWGLLAGKVKSVVYDEIQELRIQSSAKYHAARMLRDEVDFSMGLSATPIGNYGGEIWSVMQLLAPDALGSQGEFNREWCTPLSNGHQKAIDPEALGHHLRSQQLILRRTRKEIGRELPPVVRYVQEVDFDRDVYAKGTTAAAELARTILSGEFTARGQAARQLDLEMRQATGLAKAPYVADLVRMLVESGEKVLLFGWHRAVYSVWADRLRDLRPAFFTGHESDVQKERARMDFIEGRSQVLIMSLRSGAGLNGLQDTCSVCVFGEMDWSPSVHHQGIGRLARDGQTASVQVFFPVAPDGSDPVMASVLGLKEAQSQGVVDLGTAPSSELTEVDPQRMKQLALEYLKAHKLPIPRTEELLKV